MQWPWNLKSWKQGAGQNAKFQDFQQSLTISEIHLEDSVGSFLEAQEREMGSSGSEEEPSQIMVYSWGQTVWKATFLRKTCGSWWAQNLVWASNTALQKNIIMTAVLASHGKWYLVFIQHGEVVSGLLCLVSGPTLKEKYRLPGTFPAQGQMTGLGVPQIRGKAERTGMV